MALVKLGSNYRVLYESKNLVSGVDNIFAIIRRPDGVKVGPIQLSEELIAELNGTYSVDILIPSNAPVGEWTGVVYSMDESLKSAFRFSVSDFASSGGSSSDCEDDVELIIDTEVSILSVEDVSDIDLNIYEDLVYLTISSEEIEMLITEEVTELNIEDINIQLEVDCEE